MEMSKGVSLPSTAQSLFNWTDYTRGLKDDPQPLLDQAYHDMSQFSITGAHTDSSHKRNARKAVFGVSDRVIPNSLIRLLKSITSKLANSDISMV